MTDERLRVLEQAFRASGDPTDLGRWLIKAQRSGVNVDLRPLELAASCGSEAAAFTLGSHRVPDHVACFRSLCRALRLCIGRYGKRARGTLAASLLSGLETANEGQAHRRDQLSRELLEWTRDATYAHVRQSRCREMVAFTEPQFTRYGRVDPLEKLQARCFEQAITIMRPNNRSSAEALEGLLDLLASGGIVVTKEMRRSTRPQRMALLAQAQRRIEAWAFSEVAAQLGEMASAGRSDKPKTGVRAH